MLASKFLALVSLIAAPLVLAVPSTTTEHELEARTGFLDIELDICLSVDLNLGGLLGGLAKRTGDHHGDHHGFKPHTGHGSWGSHHPGGTCNDLSKVNHCYKIGHACDAKCVCVPPPPKVCTDKCKIMKCQAKGQATNTDCSCKEKCDCQDQFKCWTKGGKLDDDCKCVVPSKRWHRRDLANTCAAGSSSCPVPGSAGFECINTLSTIESCGGCSSSGEGLDCSAIEGVDSVSCNAGSCTVSSCVLGFAVSGNGTTCVKVDPTVDSDDKAWGRDVVIGALKGAESLL